MEEKKRLKWEKPVIEDFKDTEQMICADGSSASQGSCAVGDIVGQGCSNGDNGTGTAWWVNLCSDGNITTGWCNQGGTPGNDCAEGTSPSIYSGNYCETGANE